MDKNNIQLRRLGDNDIVGQFDCGDEDLNDFILTDASLYFKVRLATSYILEDRENGNVIGYFSLARPCGAGPSFSASAPPRPEYPGWSWG